MKTDEPFNDQIKSDDSIFQKLSFNEATSNDIEPIFNLMIQRNPKMDSNLLNQKVKKEILELSDGKNYGVYVAKLNEEVLGFCRFYHSQSVPKEKLKYPAPEGYYLMGIIVSPNYRRKNIARFLSERRFEVLRNLKVPYVYSCVAIDNLTSIRFHQKLGFKEIQRVRGILTVSFDLGEGILFKKDL